MPTTNIKPYYAAGLAAFIIWGFIPFPLKALEAYPSGQILYYRIALSVVLLLFISLLFRKRELMATLQQVKKSSLREKRLFLGYTTVGTVLLTANWLGFIYVVNRISIQTGSFAYMLCPILTSILGFLLLREKLRINQWLAIGLCAISCILVGTGELRSLLFSLGIALSYAFYLITQRILKSYDKLVLLTLQLVLSFAFIAPFYSYFNSEATVPLGAAFFGWVALLSGIFTVLPLFLNLFALKELTSGTVGIMMYINPVFNFVVAFVYFNEQTTPAKVIAYIIIFLSVIIYNINITGRRRDGDGLVIPAVGAAAVADKLK